MKLGTWGASLGGVVLLAGAMLGAAGRNAVIHPHTAAVLQPAGQLAAAPARVASNFGKRPLTFEANEGQTDSSVQYMAHGRGYNLFLTSGEAILTFSEQNGSNALIPIRGQGLVAGGSQNNSQHNSQKNYARNSFPEAVVRLKLTGADPAAIAEGQQKLPTMSSYYIGNDPAKWRTQVPNYARVEYRGVYPGVDVIYYGNQNQLEHDFVVAPGADAGAIRMQVSGARPRLDDRGNLILAAAGASPTLEKPVIYQTSAEGRELVAGSYTISGDTLGFSVGAYDHSLPLVIDPVLVYSTYLGGSVQDIGEDIKVDAAGNIFVIGLTESPNFPVTNGGAITGTEDAFITEFDPTGATLLLSTYLGGTTTSGGVSLALDSSDNIYVTGFTTSTDFPTTMGAFQRTLRGGINAFVTKFNSSGSMIYSTLFGGRSQTNGFGIALDAAGEAYITGQTNSPNLPVMNNFLGYGGGIDGFATKFNSMGTGLIYSTYIGGSGTDYGFYVATDSSGNAFYVGATTSPNFPTTAGVVERHQPGTTLSGFAVELSPTGTQTWGTYLGGKANDVAIGIALDGLDDVYIAGYTRSSNFPITPGVFQPIFGGVADGFLSVLTPDAKHFVFSTFIGGSLYDAAEFVAVDQAGFSYVVGNTLSPDFPTLDPVQATNGGGIKLGDGFVAKFNEDGTNIIYSTYLGGTKDDVLYAVTVDNAANAYVTGQTYSADWPTENPFQSTFAGAGGGSSNSVVSKISSTSLTIAPIAFLFPNTVMGTNGAPESFLLTNVSGGDITFSGANIGGMDPGDFTVLSTTCPGTITVGSSCTVSVEFSPLSTGFFSGQLEVFENGMNDGGVITSLLSGTGTASPGHRR
jgi:hypothetical protein